jgi:hypothetical protein
MEQNEEDKKTQIEVKFTDVMRIIADDNTPDDTKRVYIFLLNAIMDLDEALGKLEYKVKNLIGEEK